MVGKIYHEPLTKDALSGYRQRLTEPGRIDKINHCIPAMLYPLLQAITLSLLGHC